MHADPQSTIRAACVDPGRRRAGPSEPAPKTAAAHSSREGGVAAGGDQAPSGAGRVQNDNLSQPIQKETPDALDPPIDPALASDNLENVVRRDRIDAGANRAQQARWTW
jgi:hypothetical protein